MKPTLTIASYQGPALINEFNTAIQKIIQVCDIAKQADIILFPETFLHGYYETKIMAKKNAIDLSLENELDFLDQLSHRWSNILSVN